MARQKSVASFQVEEFHDAMGLPISDVRDGAHVGTERERDLRAALILEEALEFKDAVDNIDLIEMADALADLLYVTYGAAITFGIPLDAVVTEVHRSNMTKLWTDEDIRSLAVAGDGSVAEANEMQAVRIGEGERHTVVYRAFDGKVMKPPSYSPPNILKVLMGKGEV